MHIVEVGPRDGLQNENAHLTTHHKVQLIQRLLDAGTRRIEVGSFVRPDLVPQMADTEQVLARLPRPCGTHFIGLALNKRGVTRALAAGVHEINYVVSATDTFGRRNQGLTPADALAQWPAHVRTCHSGGAIPTATIAVAFGCPYEGTGNHQDVIDIAHRLAGDGAQEIALADTIGAAVPTQVTQLITAVRTAAPGIPLRCHFHNTRNTGYANAIAATQAGVQALDASIGGIGGCPFAPNSTGNIATEDLAHMLDRMGIPVGLDLAGLCATTRWISDQLTIETPALLGRAGPFPPAPAPQERGRS